MKRIALAAVGVVVATVAACSHAAPPASQGHAPIPVSCRQQYHAWAQGQGKGMISTLGAVSSAERASSNRALIAALRKARPAIARAAHHPIPACADPRGYWNVLLMHMNAAATTSSAAGRKAAMKGVPKIQQELTAEVNSTT